MSETGEDASRRRDDVFKSIGGRVRAARLRAGLTQTELATRVEMTQQYILQVERGRINMTINSLVKLADALRMDARDLLPQTGPAPIGVVLLEQLLEEYRRIVELLSARERQDAELLAAVRTIDDRRTELERALIGEKKPDEP
jgi:transcriptional regulator with XRE-family HTH domain